MNNDRFQNKYNKIVQDLKDEKMDWDFDDFLQKVEKKTESDPEIIPLNTKKPSSPKWFWMAASVALILGMGLVFNFNSNKDVESQAKLVENEIQKQKNNFIEENNDHQNQVAIHHNDSISGVKKDSLFQENALAETDVLDEILSKKSRIRKASKPKFVDNSSYQSKNLMDSTSYNDSYVIVNGKRISSEKEALDVATFSFMKMGNGFKKSVATSQQNENYTNDY